MALNVTPNQMSTYLQYLPAILQENADAQGVTFLGRFLLAFEQILSGLGDPEQPGLEEIIGGIVGPDGQMQLASLARYFDPGVRINAARRRDATRRAATHAARFSALAGQLGSPQPA